MKEVKELIDRYIKELEPFGIQEDMLYSFIDAMDGANTDDEYLELIGDYVESLGEGVDELATIINFANEFNAIINSDKPYVSLELQEEDEDYDDDLEGFLEEVPGSIGSVFNSAFKPLGHNKRTEAELRADFRESLREIEDVFEEIIGYIDL